MKFKQTFFYEIKDNNRENNMKYIIINKYIKQMKIFDNWSRIR